MALLKAGGVNNGEWSLPSVKDLLNSVDTPQGPSSSIQAGKETFCKRCLTKDRNVPLLDGKRCSFCALDCLAAEKQSTSQHPAPPAIPISYDQSPYHADPAYFSRRSSLAELSYSAEPYHSLQPERNSQSPPYTLSVPHPGHAMLPSSLTPNHHSHSDYAPSRPRLSSNLTPAKIASNDRHKLSEKHRRDGMGAFVQAGDILRKGINPGLLSHCSVCHADAAQDSPQSPTSPPSSFTGLPPSNVKPKKPKNNMLEESLMWEFSWLLHFTPGEVASHLEGIRMVAAQMARDKEYGMRHDWAKKKKWDADVRSDVLEQALRYLERESERHGVDPCVRDEASRGRKRKIMDVDGVMTPVLTPPSSRSSPTFGRMPSGDRSHYDNEARRSR